MRQIVFDTETTGLSAERGHRIIEIGCVELIERRRTGVTFHRYLNPDRDSDPGALEVHGLTTEFLSDKPRFRDVVGELLEFLRGAELVIHNAAFDLSFLDAELALVDPAGARSRDLVSVLDTLTLARERYPGQKNSLDALCKRLGIDNSHRELHGALLDASLLADVYLAMTAGQASLMLSLDAAAEQKRRDTRVTLRASNSATLRVLRAEGEDLARHEARLSAIEKAAKAPSLWRRLEAAATVSDSGTDPR